MNLLTMQVLTYGILTAAVLRAIIVLLGVELIDTFQPVLLGFAAILIYSSAKILLAGDEDEDDDLSDNNIVKLCRQVPSPPGLCHTSSIWHCICKAWIPDLTCIHGLHSPLES